jgi:hypothetical protein
MRLIGLAVVLSVSLAIVPLVVEAQQSGKVYRIGVLETMSATLNTANLDAFRQGLRELGYEERRDFVIEYRSADGRPERFPGLATTRSASGRESHRVDSNRHGDERRPGWLRHRLQPRPPGWECYGVEHDCRRVSW